MVYHDTDWRGQIKARDSPHHIMSPMWFRVRVDHCVLENDPNLPKLAVGAEVPEIKVDLEESQLYSLLNITYSAGASLPAAERDAEADAKVGRIKTYRNFFPLTLAFYKSFKKCFWRIHVFI